MGQPAVGELLPDLQRLLWPLLRGAGLCHLPRLPLRLAPRTGNLVILITIMFCFRILMVVFTFRYSTVLTVLGLCFGERTNEFRYSTIYSIYLYGRVHFCPIPGDELASAVRRAGLPEWWLWQRQWWAQWLLSAREGGQQLQHTPGASVVEPEPPFLAGAGAVKKGAAPAPAQGPAMTPCLKKR